MVSIVCATGSVSGNGPCATCGVCPSRSWRRNRCRTKNFQRSTEMTIASRIVSPQIPVLNDKGRQCGWFTGKEALPLELNFSAEVFKDGSIDAPRYYLTIYFGQLVYLHEAAPVV